MTEESKKKLDPAFRKVLYELSMEYITKSPDDFVEFAVEFFKKKQQIKVAKIKPMEEEKSEVTESEDIDEEEEDITEIRQNRKNIFQESIDLNQIFSDQIIFKTSEQKALLKKEMTKILIFRSLHEEDLNYLVDIMGKKRVSIKEIIITQGDEGDFFYIVESGKFIAYKIKENEIIVLQTYENEGYFGELALLYNVPRSCSVKAESDGELWYLDRMTFRRIVTKAAIERRKQYVEFLQKVPLLAGLSDEERLNLADCLEPRIYPSGGCIIREGDNADGMFFLLSGTAKVMVQQIGHALEVEVKEIKAGDYFGELALVTHRPRAASVYAVNEVQVAFLDIQSFERLLGPCIDIMKRNITEYDTQLKHIQEPLKKS